MSLSFSSWPCFDADEIAAVESVLKSGRVNYWTGEQGRLFEREFASYVGCQYGIALANGTLALELALRSLDIGPGDEVVVSPRTFMASASAIMMVGARPVFADVDADSQDITVSSILAALTENTRAVICVHLAGWPCDMDPIIDLARKRGLKVIEDCAQAHGARYKGLPVGGLGDVAAFSFCQDKIVTTGGEGGMLTTNDAEVWKKGWSFKDHGKDWDLVNQKSGKSGFRWLHAGVGSNYRMTEMQAAIGRIQLRKLNGWRRQRQQNSSLIENTSRGFSSLRVPEIPDSVDHGRYKQYVFVRPEGLKGGWNRDRIVTEIERLGVPCFSGSCPEVYLEEAFSDTNFRPVERLSNARDLGETSLMFQVHPTLTESEVSITCAAIEKVMSEATL